MSAMMGGLGLCWACQSSVHAPRPKGYPRLLLPSHSYRPSPDTLPYAFEYSTHALWKRDTSWIAERFWTEVVYPEWQASVQLTYKSLENQRDLLEEILYDTYRLTAKHQVKAHRMEEKVLILKSGQKASLTRISGEVPSPYQFHVTDSMRHFLRGAVYLNTATKNDSLAPIIDFLYQDVLHALSTLQWKKSTE